MQVVTDAEFEAEVLKSGKPVLVDFYADWCGPCKGLAPTLDKIADETAATLKVVKVNVDKSPELVAKYRIQSMPTLLIIRNGEEVSRKIGGNPKAALLDWIDKSLALPADAKPDPAVKTVILSTQDKQRLRDAFQAALDASPVTDAALRKSIQEAIESGKIFEPAEAFLAAGATMDEVVKKFRNTQFGPKPQ